MPAQLPEADGVAPRRARARPSRVVRERVLARDVGRRAVSAGRLRPLLLHDLDDRLLVVDVLVRLRIILREFLGDDEPSRDHRARCGEEGEGNQRLHVATVV